MINDLSSEIAIIGALFFLNSVINTIIRIVKFYKNYVEEEEEEEMTEAMKRLYS
jgi:hypothetical protein